MQGLKLNTWYVLEGNPRDKRNFLSYLLEHGWAWASQMGPNDPAMIRLSFPEHKLNYRTNYSARFMGSDLPKIVCIEFLKQINKGENKMPPFKEYPMPGCPTTCESKNDPNRILELSYRKEAEALEKSFEAKTHNIKMDNVYIAAISNAIAKVNEKSKNKVEVNVLELICNQNIFLSDEDNKALNDAYSEYDKDRSKLKERYQVAETLLAMADTYQEKKAILDKYTKDVL